MAQSPLVSSASLAFRNRAGEITRLEALSDGIFAFAITLLVVSLEVPGTFAELMTVIRGFPAFAVCFTLLMWIWFQHWRFFRRYGLEDAATVAINATLLFVVLFYVYPLKFLWTLLLGAFTGGRGAAVPAGAEPMMRFVNGATLMQIYGLGFMAIFYLLALLYAHAYRRREALALNELEQFDTRSGIIENVAVGSVGLVSITLVTLWGSGAGFLAGISYGLIGVVKAGHGFWNGSRRAQLEKQVMSATAGGSPR
jgi:uncharacterized membrane protein